MNTLTGDVGSYSIGSEDAKTLIDGKFTALGWRRAILTGGILAVPASFIGIILWNIVYRGMPLREDS